MNAQIDVSSLVIETPRLLLRSVREDDLEDFFEYARVDGVGQMAGWPPHQSIDNTKAVLEDMIREKKTLALWHKADCKMIGTLGIETYNASKLVEFDRFKGREIGYVLSKDYWGRGLMPEAVKAVISWCFDELDMDFLTCGYFAFNSQSKRVQEKCGFKPYRHLVFDTIMGTKEDGFLNLLLNPEKSIQIERIHPETLVNG